MKMQIFYLMLMSILSATLTDESRDQFDSDWEPKPISSRKFNSRVSIDSNSGDSSSGSYSSSFSGFSQISSKMDLFKAQQNFHFYPAYYFSPSYGLLTQAPVIFEARRLNLNNVHLQVKVHWHLEEIESCLPGNHFYAGYFRVRVYVPMNKYEEHQILQQKFITVRPLSDTKWPVDKEEIELYVVSDIPSSKEHFTVYVTMNALDCGIDHQMISILKF